MMDRIFASSLVETVSILLTSWIFIDLEYPIIYKSILN